MLVISSLNFDALFDLRNCADSFLDSSCDCGLGLSITGFVGRELDNFLGISSFVGRGGLLDFGCTFTGSRLTLLP